MDARTGDRGSYLFGPFRLDPVRRGLRRDGETVALPPKAFDLLLVLVENADRLVTKDELLRALWPGRIVEEGSLSQAVFQLRRGLAAGGTTDRLILNAPGQGYRFAAPVSVDLETVASEGASSPSRPAARAGWITKTREPLVLAGVAMATLILVVIVAFLHGARRPSGRVPTVVLAQFRNLTGDPAFDEAAGRVLEVDLAQSPSLRVLSHGQVDGALALMKKPPNSILTPDLATAVCARNQGGAVIEGTIAGLGGRYLLTLSATDCLSRRILADAKTEAPDKASTIRALDRLAGKVRSALGESRTSIAMFDVPLAAEKTSSFDALVAYSRATFLNYHGLRPEAVLLFRRALQLDPDFAIAHADLAALLRDMTQRDEALDEIKKAFALRFTVGEREKFRIVDLYDRMVTGDVDAEIRTLNTWSTVYPYDFQARFALSNAERRVGRWSAAIQAAQDGLVLNDRVEHGFDLLMRAYTRAGQLDQALAVAARAERAGLATTEIRSQLAEIAFARHDAAEVQRQFDWARGRSGERVMTYLAAMMAFSDGRAREGLALFDRVGELDRQQGLDDPYEVQRAFFLMQLGFNDRALAMLKRSGVASDSWDYLYVMAMIGDPGQTEALLDKEVARHPAYTLLNRWLAPAVRAALLSRRGRPAEALATLRATGPYQMLFIDGPYQRGCIRLQMGDGAGAAEEFRAVLSHQGLYPEWPSYPLAMLGLARALRLQGDPAASRREYTAFLDRWKNADPDAPVLIQAKREAASLL